MKLSLLSILFSCLCLLSCQNATQENPPAATQDSLTFNFQWEHVNTPTSASLRGLSAVSENIAWTSGSEATCFMTKDGGQSWQSFSFEVPDTLQFRDVEAFDAQIAYLLSAGSPGLIYKTTDGGQSWTLQYENTHPAVFLDGMAFWNAQEAIVMGDPLEGYFTLLRTDDGGEHWERIASANLPAPQQGEGGFAASGTNIVVQGEQHAWFASGGKASRVFYSMDGGRQWQFAETPVQQGEASQGIFSLAFADTLLGVGVGGDYLVPEDTSRIACYTTDGGRSWQLAQQMPSGYRSGVAYFPEDQLFIAVGTNGSDYSTDFGKSWTPLDTTAFHGIQAVPGASAAWLSGNDGRVAKLRW
ncbi:WD40/YVTN/BNR-like repeat-containing protein [Catalinimonas niigatensis]|uniref:WD40/YVTN/BNR-like repeat-containing protein n=1 Tax=Catalinimonas niigatensis TaxID=1397264 RepID=UPI0026666F18|nr:YCF48-related protein [Catalinimonas niigatensis]WPP48820.1 YCF48-related protein [Catalinimonas niigatensis]